MKGWVCPSCDRLFDRPGRGHDCSPGLTIEEYFAAGPRMVGFRGTRQPELHDRLLVAEE